jgi:hypothetical protein
MEAVGLSDYMTKTASIQVKGNVSTFATYRMCNLSLFRQISHTSNQNTGNVGRITERVQQWIVDQGDHIERLPRDNAKNQRIAMNAERCISRKSGVLIHSSRIYNICREMNFAESDGLAVRRFNGWIIPE